MTEDEITSVNIFTLDDKWYFVAWIGPEYDCCEKCDDCDCEVAAAEFVARKFPHAKIERIYISVGE